MDEGFSMGYRGRQVRRIKDEATGPRSGCGIDGACAKVTLAS